MPRRGLTALPWILGLAVVMVLMGVTGSMQVSATRTAFERIHARRVVDLAAMNAFEEVAARLEKDVPRVPTPKPGVPRDLGAAFEPRAIEPVLTRASMQGDGVELSSVKVKSSPWRLDMKQVERGQFAVSERGIVEMSLVVTVTAGTTVVTRRVTSRRFARAAPEPGEKQSRFHVESTPFVRILEQP